MAEDLKDVEPRDRILVGFTWYAVTSVEGDVVYAAQEGRAPHRFLKDHIREVVEA